MRFKEFYLTEMPFVNTMKDNDVSKMVTIDYLKKLYSDVIETKPIKSFGTVKLYEQGGFYYFLDYQRENIVAGLTLDSKNCSIKDIPQVTYIRVVSDMNGRGFAKHLYEVAIKHFGAIESDKSLTKFKKSGSVYIWKSLSKQYYMYSLIDGELEKIKDVEDPKYNKMSITFIASIKELKDSK